MKNLENQNDLEFVTGKYNVLHFNIFYAVLFQYMVAAILAECRGSDGRQTDRPRVSHMHARPPRVCGRTRTL
jgi:hypothetical protein